MSINLKANLSIGSLFYKDDTDPGFFLEKVNKRIFECSKQATYNAIQQIINSSNEVVASREFWLNLALPSCLTCVVLDIIIQLDDKMIDLDELRKSCLADKNLESNPNPRYIINLVNYIYFLIVEGVC